MKKTAKLFLCFALVLAMCSGLFQPGIMAYASAGGDPGKTTPAKTAAAQNKISGTLRMAATDGQIKAPIAYGIDVSAWQDDIDWNKVKSSGVSFAFIRVAYRTYGKNSGKLFPDTKAIDNINGAKAAGIRVGVYCFSTAINAAEALEEAKYTLDMIKGYKLDLPVVYDQEGYNVSSYRNYDANASSPASVKKRTDNALVFLKYVESQGYKGMIYSSQSHMESNTYWDMSRLQGYYDVWVAQYFYKNASKGEMYHDFASLAARNTKYSGRYRFWQGTDAGYINGIRGGVDLDLEYAVDYSLNKASAVQTTAQPASTRTGWGTASDGSKFYEEKGVKLTGLKTIAGKKYLFSSAGKMLVGQQSVNGQYYYFDTSSGVMVTNRFITLKDKKGKSYKVYYGADGRRLSGTQTIGEYHYFFDENTGAMAKKKWKTFYNSKGKAYKVYYDNKGRRASGQKKIGKYYYYFAIKSGAMQKNKWKTLYNKKGKAYKVYYNKKGRRVSGWVKIKKKWYYFDKKTGARQ